MSALPPTADIRQRIEHVCFVPEADIRTSPIPSLTLLIIAGQRASPSLLVVADCANLIAGLRVEGGLL
jgi:hypothetical protein